MQSQECTVKGKIVDSSTKEALEFASVTFNPKESDNVVGGITNEKGNFDFKVPKGNYTVTIAYLGYKDVILKSQNITKKVNFGEIELILDTELLEDINITAEKKTIIIKPKKMVYNVSKDIASDGGTITDVINNIPSVSYNNGTATIRGQKATIMINGKISSLTKEDVLKSFPAGSIENIEIIANPGAQYNSEYKSILNLIIKKGKDQGLNASITSSVGFKDIYGGLISLNHKSKKVNFYTNTSYAHKNKIITSKANNEYFTGGVTSSFLNETREFDSKESSILSTIGADFYLSDKTTLTTTVNYTKIKHKRKTVTDSYFLNANYIETDSNKRLLNGNFDDEIYELGLDITHNFNKEGRTLTSYIKYSNDQEYYNDVVTNSNLNFTDANFNQINKLFNTEFDIKYKTPITKTTTLTLGYNDNYDKIPFRNSIINRNIDFSRDINAAYIDYEYETDKFYIGTGLRGEFSKTSINYLDLNRSQERSFNNIFPTVYSQYAISDSKIIVLNYQKNITRPDYVRIQPFEEKFSETSSYIGNESLDPMQTDTYSLTYLYYGSKITLSQTLSIHKLDNYWQDVTYQTGEQVNGINKLLTTPQNVGFLNLYTANFTAIFKASNTLNLTFSANLNNFDRHGVFKTIDTLNQPIAIDYNSVNFSGDFNLSTQLKLQNKINIQANVFHYLKSDAAVSTRKEYTFVSLSMSKDVFKKNATLSLNINDVFNSNQTERDRYDANYFSSSLVKNKYPDIVFSFTYRLNQSKKKRKIDFNKKERKPNF